MAVKNYEEKIIYGMSNIHVALLKDGVYGSPIPILGAKSVECSFEVSEKMINADNKAVFSAKTISKGSGSLSLLGLTPDERRLLQNGVETVGYGLKSSTNMPSFALMFQQEKADGKKILYVIYSLSFSPNGINATSVEDGIEENPTDLEFTCIPGKNDYFYYAVDTAETGAETIASTFFTEVTFPKASV